MWPFKPKSDMSFDSWPIIRTEPGGTKLGVSLAIFIDNWQCHYASVDVYEDGAIDCWGFLDLDLFRQKMKTSWAVASPRVDQNLSFFNLGYSEPVQGNWLKRQSDILGAVEQTVKELNPRSDGLIDMHGSDTELRGKVRYAKMGTSDKKAYRIEDGDRVLGDPVPALLKVDDGYRLVRLTVYQDSLVQVGPSNELVSMQSIASSFESGLLSMVVPEGVRIDVPGLGYFTTKDEFGYIDSNARIGEMYDIINRLNGKDSVVTTCAKAFDAFESDPTDEARETLRAAYESVPEHLRMYCGDMDTKDSDIRAALYGE